jgi:hypothetical protein
MLTPQELNSLNDATKAQYLQLCEQKDRFIEPDRYDSAGLFDWLTSKGTSFNCYVKYVNETNNDPMGVLNQKIDVVRIIFYAFLKPIESQFFYWTLLLLIMYKFNTKRPVTRLILYHYTLRTMGDIVEKLGELTNNYYAVDAHGNCVNNNLYTEQNPLKWFMTRQVNGFFWHIGEIVGDWYPLIRTKAVAKDGPLLKYVYMSCILYNIVKLSVPISQIFLFPTRLYNKTGDYNYDYVNKYYNYYYALQVLVVIASLIYDIIVYIVLKKELFNKTISEYGFLKKFRLISEYRIIVSVVIGMFGLPIYLIVAIIKIVTFNSDLKAINFSFENFRLVVTNVQYMIIFIDQILLICSRNESLNGTESDTCTCSCSCSVCRNKSKNSDDYYCNDNGNENNIKLHNYSSQDSYPNLNNRNYFRKNTTQNNAQYNYYSEMDRMKFSNVQNYTFENNNNNNFRYYNNFN